MKNKYSNFAASPFFFFGILSLVVFNISGEAAGRAALPCMRDVPASEDYNHTLPLLTMCTTIGPAKSGVEGIPRAGCMHVVAPPQNRAWVALLVSSIMAFVWGERHSCFDTYKQDCIREPQQLYLSCRAYYNYHACVHT